jgi:hypothetical protein
MAGDVNLVRYVRNQTLVNVDFEGWQGQGWSISPIGTLELPPYMPLLPKPEPLTKPKPSILPKPDQTIRGNVPDTITGFPYGWNHLWTPSQRDEMNRECCNMAPNPPTFASTGPGTGEYIIYGLPTDRPQIGTGGANPCVAVIIKCDDVVYVYHYDAPSKPASYPEIKNKRIVLRLSAAVLRTTTLMVNPQGV